MGLSWILVLSFGACDNSDTEKAQEGEPWVEGLVLSPDPAYETDTLTCSWDSLRGAETATISWQINDQVVEGLDSETLSGAWFDRRDQVACRAQSDHAGSPVYVSNVVWIRNSPPVVESVSVSPEDPVEGDILRVSSSVVDPDGEDELFVETHYRWWVDDQEVGEDADILGSAYFDEGQSIVVEVWGSDGLVTGESVRSEAVVAVNTPPSPPEVELESTASGLECRVLVESEDPDPADTVVYSYDWWEFGQAHGGGSDTLSLDNVLDGGAYSCRVTPNDGDEDGEPGWASLTQDGDVLRYRWTFTDAGAYAGSRMLVLPDFDGDGLEDLLVATVDGSVIDVEGGGAVLLGSAAFGENSELGEEAHVARLLSPYGFASAGYDLDVVADLDGDALPEIAITLPGYGEGKGLAMVVSSLEIAGGGDIRLDGANPMSNYTVVQGFDEAEGVGQSVASADVDDDGLDELAVGVADPWQDGRGTVKLFWGEAVAQGRGLYMDDAITFFDGDGGGFGADVAFLPGSDGTAEYIAIGAPDLGGGAGGVIVHDVSALQMRSGNESMHPISTAFATFEIEGEAVGDALGSRLEAIELDDGTYTLAIGAPGAAGGAGSIYFWTPDKGDDLSLCAAVVGSGNDGIGMAISRVADTDGDGSSELLVGAPGADDGFEDAGAVYLVSLDGPATGVNVILPTDATFAFGGEAEDDRLGSSVVGSADWGEGGRVGVAMGAPGIVQPVEGLRKAACLSGSITEAGQSMPELAEVEWMVRGLREHAQGHFLDSLEVRDARLLEGAEHLSGMLQHVERRAKYIQMEFDSFYLVLHPRMTGRLVWGFDERARAIFRFRGGSVVSFVDPRRFGTLQEYRNDELAAFFRDKNLGDEPWPEQQDGAWWERRLGGRRLPVKTALMRQDLVAGLGNIAGVEICWRIGLDPRTPTQEIQASKWGELAAAVWEHLAVTLSDIGTSLELVGEGGENGFLVYGRGGEPCPRCQTPIERFLQSGRGTYWCPACQLENS